MFEMAPCASGVSEMARGTSGGLEIAQGHLRWAENGLGAPEKGTKRPRDDSEASKMARGHPGSIQNGTGALYDRPK